MSFYTTNKFVNYLLKKNLQKYFNGRKIHENLILKASVMNDKIMLTNIIYTYQLAALKCKYALTRKQLNAKCPLLTKRNVIIIFIKCF